MRRSLFFVIAAAKILFQPDIQTDEEIAAAHFFNGKFRISNASVSPGDRHDRPAIAAPYGLEWKLNSQVEMGRQQWKATFDPRGAIGFEGVGRIVQLNPKQQSDKKVR